MTSTLVTEETRVPRLLHWRAWVVPACILRDFIYDHKHVWQFRYSPPQNEVTGWNIGSTGITAEDQGWRIHLSLEVSMTVGQSVETVQRNLYRVLTNEGNVINVDFAEAVVMSLGLDIDRDTEIPVLPGNLRNAHELLEVRDPGFWERTKEEQARLKRTVLELSNEIIRHPEQLKELQDAAPFDCLRPPR